jgi:hypothetical protein
MWDSEQCLDCSSIKGLSFSFVWLSKYAETVNVVVPLECGLVWGDYMLHAINVENIAGMGNLSLLLYIIVILF